MNQLERDSRRKTSSGRSQSRGSDRSTSYRKSEGGSRNRRSSQSSRSGSSYGYRSEATEGNKGGLPADCHCGSDFNRSHCVYRICGTGDQKRGSSRRQSRERDGDRYGEAGYGGRSGDNRYVQNGSGSCHPGKISLVHDHYLWGGCLSGDGSDGGKSGHLLDEIYTGDPQESYSLDTTGLEEAIASEAVAAAAKWDKSPKNGSIQSFDKESGKFVFAGEEAGFAIDQEKLARIFRPPLTSAGSTRKSRLREARYSRRLRRPAQRTFIKPSAHLPQPLRPTPTAIPTSVWRRRPSTAP